ncbi:hypothetical protein [Undibacterium sp. SXout20W]|uniref:hypothetical protein n=1 Tax=Undibacterium sp. SXout20W TaxID=3413051 RepID=UPI003BEFD1A0
MASVTFDASRPRCIAIRWNDFANGFVVNGQNLGRHGKAIATYFFRFSASWISRDDNVSGSNERLLVGPSNDRAALSYKFNKDPQHPGCSLIVGEFSVTDPDHPIIQTELAANIAPEFCHGQIAEDFNAPFFLGHWIVNFPLETQAHASVPSHQRRHPLIY